VPKIAQEKRLQIFTKQKKKSHGDEKHGTGPATLLSPAPVVVVPDLLGGRDAWRMSAARTIQRACGLSHCTFFFMVFVGIHVWCWHGRKQ